MNSDLTSVQEEERRGTAVLEKKEEGLREMANDEATEGDRADDSVERQSSEEVDIRESTAEAEGSVDANDKVAAAGSGSEGAATEGAGNGEGVEIVARDDASVEGARDTSGTPLPVLEGEEATNNDNDASKPDSEIKTTDSAEGAALTSEAAEEHANTTTEDVEEAVVDTSATDMESPTREDGEENAFLFDDVSSAPTDSVQGDEIEGFDDDFRALGLEKDEPAYLGEMDMALNKDVYETHAAGTDILEEASLKLARLNAAIEEAEEESERLAGENTRHQLGLLSIFNARKTTTTSSIPEQKKITDSSSSTRYMQSLAQWITMIEDRERLASAQEALEFEGFQSLNDKQMRADDVCRSYNEFVREVARQSEYSRTGKLLPAKLVDAMVTQEERKDEEVRHVRLRNIQLRTQVRKLDWRLKAKEELAEGLHLIDFEQLKIENQSLNEKIEERNEELLKLRKKTTSTVQVVTHLKEKLQFVHKENSVLEETLKKLEARLSSQRDRTQFVKHELTALKTKNRQFRRQSEVVTSRPLLRDVEVQKKKREDLLSSISAMKAIYTDKTSRVSTTSYVAGQATE